MKFFYFHSDFPPH